MSFGFSVGDFVAVGKLVVEITNSLRDAGGSKSEYQDLLRELESLQHALEHLDKLQTQSSPSVNLDRIKSTALSCRRPLEDFLGKTRRYEKSLGVWGKPGARKETADKVRWALGRQQEVHKLQSYLSVHVGMINMLLSEYGLERMTLDQQHVCEGLEGIRGAIQQVHTILGDLQAVNEELSTSWKSLSELVAKLCASTQETYRVMLQIKGSPDTIDTQRTFFQTPLRVEDALGFCFPVPSEYDYDLLVVVIKHKFSSSPGRLEVEAGNYELFDAKDRQVLSPRERLFPGTNIIMAILVSKVWPNDDACPKPGCRSNRTTKAQDGRRVCSNCDVRFDQARRKRKLSAITDMRVQELDGSDDETSLPAGPSQNRKRRKTSRREKNMWRFRNMRWMAEEGVLQAMMTTPKFPEFWDGKFLEEPEAMQNFVLWEEHGAFHEI